MIGLRILKHLFGHAAALTLALSVPLSNGHANALKLFAWSHRPIIIYAPEHDSADLNRQRHTLLSVAQELIERDIVLIEVVGDRMATLVGPPFTGKAEALRRQHGIRYSAFCIVLVGKDAGVKMRSFEHIAADRLFELIDNMPMRRREMKERAKH